MKNGLIPNLLNKGNCRYNCRDATWWWLYSIVKYLDLVPNGVNILEEVVNVNGKATKLQDVIHLAIQTHFEGIHFREENAGPRIDAHMKDEGFNIDIIVDPKTGRQ
jgi:glycogen debranching enzyme